MVAQRRGADTVMAGLLPDSSALYGVLDLGEFRKLVPNSGGQAC
jgi:hypothetical protein